MITELNQTVKRCPNCRTNWTFSDEDVLSKETRDFREEYTENYIICPKCRQYLQVFKVGQKWE